MSAFAFRASTLIALFIWLSSFRLGRCEPKPLAIDFVASAESFTTFDRLAKRGPVGVNLYGPSYIYYANASLGTPPQQSAFIVDTNSADVLVWSASNVGTCGTDAQCKSEGLFNPKASSSYAYLNSNFSVTFGDGETAVGGYATDNFKIADVEITKLQFGLANNGTLTDNILGIGYIGLESKPSSYANLPVRMFNDGMINVIGYSMWFNHANTTTGRLILGGVDTNRFIGTLETVPINMQQLQYNYVTIQLDAISVSTGSNSTNITDSKFRVIADSGTSTFVFPQDVIYQIGNLTNAVVGPYGYLLKEYTALDNDTTIDLIFGGTNISVSMPDLVIPYNDTFAYLNMASGQYGSLNVLGVPFFRSAYLVFDYSHNQISMAPINRGEQPRNVTAINENGVAGLTGVSLSSSSSSSSSGSSGLSTGAKVGIGVGVSLGVLALIGIGVAVFLLRKRRRTRQERPTKVDDSNNSGFGKAELPASEKRVDELDSAQAKTPASEMATNNQTARAELYNADVPSKSFAPQELQGDMPERREMETEFNQPTSTVSDMTSGASNSKETPTETGTSKSLLSSRQ